MFAVLLMCTLQPPKYGTQDVQASIEQSILSIIYSQDDKMMSTFRNMSSMVVDQKFVKGKVAEQWFKNKKGVSKFDHADDSD